MTGRWRTEWASRCGPTWRPRSTAWPPRRGRRPGCSCRSTAPSAPTPSRQACSPRTRTRSGSRRRARSLHRYGTELDLGPPAAYAWLDANARRFGFIHRYAWEPWHYGFGANPRDRQHPARYEQGSWEPPGGDHGRIKHGLPSFVPARFHDPIAKAALRWNVPMNVLAAQLYAESGFNPFARSPAGAEGIAQFMPGTADAYGLDNPFDPMEAIDAQAHLMSDLLEAVRRQGRAGARGLQRGCRGGRALWRHPAIRRDARLRDEDPGPAGRRGGDTPRERIRGEARGVGSTPHPGWRPRVPRSVEKGET